MVIGRGLKVSEAHRRRCRRAAGPSRWTRVPWSVYGPGPLGPPYTDRGVAGPSVDRRPSQVHALIRPTTRRFLLTRTRPGRLPQFPARCSSRTLLAIVIRRSPTFSKTPSRWERKGSGPSHASPRAANARSLD